MIIHTRVPPSRRPPAPAPLVCLVLLLLVFARVASGTNAQSPVAPPPSSPPSPEPSGGPPTGQTGSVYCPVCGTRNRAGSRFCLKDGSPLPALDPTRVLSGFVRDPATYSPEEIQEAVHRASRAVVRVRVKSTSTLKYPVTGHPEGLRVRTGHLETVEGESRLVGSGFVIGPGEIVTNAHVATPFGAPAQITVETQDGGSFPARLRGVDHASDLALLQVDSSSLPALAWGNSDELRLGDETWAIGNPLDVGISVTRGTISTLARMHTGMNQVEAFLHSDAFITHGNSGGPLVDVLGRVVGVSDMGYEEDRGQGYSIPSGMARLVVDRLRRAGRYERGFLGLQVRQVDADSVTKYGLKRTTGVVVESVLKGTPAEAAGFRPGDVMFGINGRQAASAYLLQEAVSSVGPNASVVIALDRGGQVLNLRPTSAVRPDAPRIDPVLALENYMMVRFEEDPKRHDVVIRVPNSFSPAPRFGFNDGDVVESVLAAQDWPDEPITLDYYKRKGHAVPLGSLAELRSALGRMYLGGRVGVAFQIKRSVQPIAAVAYDETWPIVF